MNASPTSAARTISRRDWCVPEALRRVSPFSLSPFRNLVMPRTAFASAVLILLLAGTPVEAKPPNVLVMMSDDQSFPHASVYGSKMVSTPNFDRIARDGMLFNNAFCAAPGCSPSRAAFLTGRHIWIP